MTFIYFLVRYNILCFMASSNPLFLMGSSIGKQPRITAAHRKQHFLQWNGKAQAYRKYYLFLHHHIMVRPSIFTFLQ